MDERLVWTVGATADLQSIFAELGDSRGNTFVRQVGAALKLLKVFPEQAPIFLGAQRRLLVGRQQRYGLFYTIHGERIAISAVVDLRQDPELIVKLIRNRTNG